LSYNRHISSYDALSNKYTNVIFNTTIYVNTTSNIPTPRVW